MGLGLDADTEYLRRSSIPSGGAGTLSEGATEGARSLTVSALASAMLALRGQ